MNINQSQIELQESFAWELLELEIELEMSQADQLDPQVIKKLLAVEYYETQNSNKHQYFLKKILKTYSHPYFTKKQDLFKSPKMEKFEEKNIQITLKNIQNHLDESQKDIDSRNQIINNDLQAQNNILQQRIDKRKSQKLLSSAKQQISNEKSQKKNYQDKLDELEKEIQQISQFQIKINTLDEQVNQVSTQFEY